MVKPANAHELFTAKQRGWAQYKMDLDNDETPDEATVDGVLSNAQAYVGAHLEELLLEDDVEIAYDGAEDGQPVAVLSSESNEIWSRLEDEIDGADELLEFVQLCHKGYINQKVDLVHARYPFVLIKTPEFRDGETFTQAHIAHLMGEYALNGSIVIDYWMVEIRGLTQSEWADMARKSQGTVSDNVAQARTIIKGGEP